MSLFDDLLQGETLAGVKSKIIGFAQGAGLLITNWIQGGVGEQLYQTFALTTWTYTKTAAQAIRGYASLDTSSDPGDEDAFVPANVDLTPEPGFLSHFGENTFGTVRGSETFAAGGVVFDNSLGQVARTFGPDALVFTWTEGGDVPDPPPTYRNAEDASIYTNPDGTVTVLAGATLEVPVRAEEAGVRSNAGPGRLSLTTSMVGVTATNPSSILGTDREAAALYRARCRQAAARLSLGGPSAAYAYLAAKNLDGTPLLNASDSEVAITRTYVSQDSDTGIVEAFFASDDGAPLPEDVTAANENIEAQSFAVPDAITYTGQAAIEVTISVAGTAKFKSAAGVTQAILQNAIVAALVEYFKTIPIGGVDQVLGAGVVYTKDLQAAAAKAYPGLYNVSVTAPVAASTALPKGRVAVLDTEAADWTVTLV